MVLLTDDFVVWDIQTIRIAPFVRMIVAVRTCLIVTVTTLCGGHAVSAVVQKWRVFFYPEAGECLDNIEWVGG